MSTQTEAQRVKFATPDAGTTIEFLKAIALISARDTEWQSITSYQQRTLEKMQDGYAARIAELELGNPLADLPSFPPLPEGFSRWVYRGKGWKSEKRVRFASYGRFDTDWVTFPFECTVGYETTHYIEAVKDPA